jgi:hypothetical protein
MAPALPFIAIGAQVLGAVSSFQGAQAQTQANINAARHNQQVAEFNAATSRNNAIAARQASQVQAQKIRQETARRISTIKTKFAKGGVVSTEGSALLVAMEQAREGQLSVEEELFAGENAARGFQTEASLSDLEAGRQVQKASTAKTAGRIAGATSILSSVGSFAGSGASLF